MYKWVKIQLNTFLIPVPGNCAVRFIPRPLYSYENSPPFPLDSRVATTGLDVQKKKNFLPLLAIELRIPGRTATGLVMVLEFHSVLHYDP